MRAGTQGAFSYSIAGLQAAGDTYSQAGLPELRWMELK